MKFVEYAILLVMTKQVSNNDDADWCSEVETTMEGLESEY